MRTFSAAVLFSFLLAAAGCGSGREALGSAHLAFDGAKAFSLVQAQVAFGPRVPGTTAHRACADYCINAFQSAGATLDTDRWVHVSLAGDSLPLVNIRAAFNPEARDRILLCAHWDSRPVADHDPDPANHGTPIDGANDGASGVAVLLELARVFKDQPPPLGVDLVLFDGEDYGDFYADKDVLLGSRRFAGQNRAYRPAFGVLLDMVGDREAAFPFEGNSLSALPDVCRLVWDKAAELGYGKYFPRQEGTAVIDDHIPLLQAGIRCIDLIQMGLPYWHTLGDTPDKLSPASLEAVGRTLAAVIYDRRP
ncbi:M28 family peptidase [bacterium]|nr:M28 family peptidase [bacterium]